MRGNLYDRTFLIVTIILSGNLSEINRSQYLDIYDMVE